MIPSDELDVSWHILARLTFTELIHLLSSFGGCSKYSTRELEQSEKCSGTVQLDTRNPPAAKPKLEASLWPRLHPILILYGVN